MYAAGVAAAFTIIAATYVGVSVYNNSPWVEKGVDVLKNSIGCKSPECKAAKRITSYMDPKVNPCDDFYHFACGNYLKTAKIQQDMDRKDVYTDLSKTVQDQLKQLVHEKPRPNDPRPIHYLKNYFQMCMDEEAIEKRGVDHVMERLVKAGGWPMAGNWQQMNWHWFTTELELSKMNMDDGSLFTLSITEDIGRSDRRVIWIDQGKLPLPREYLLKDNLQDPVIQAYLNYIENVATAFGAVINDDLKKSIRQLYRFQVELAKVQSTQASRENYDRMYNVRTWKQLLEDKKLNWVEWKPYFQTVMPEGITLKNDEIFIFPEVDYIKNLGIAIRNTPKDIVANHMMFMAVHSKVPYLSKNLMDQLTKVKTLALGKKPEIPRWEVCMHMAPSLDLALSSLYVQRFFDPSSKAAASDMMARIREEMMKDFKELDWMDKETREKAESKASLTHEVVGYPEEITDMAKLEEHYAGLNLNEEHLFEAQLDLAKWFNRYSFKLLREPVVKKDWRQFGTAHVVNAFFDQVANSIIIPAGILQPPFFGAKLPSYVNYASIGSIMGHELTHGFDYQGAQFNGKGDKDFWWSDRSWDKLTKQKKCSLNQYGAFIEPQTQEKIDGLRTQSENIADIGGLKMAFRAYRQRASQLAEPEPMLPGLKGYSREQLFMISLANAWCSVSTPERMMADVLGDSHSPSQFRVNGMLMNLEEFGDVFKCAPGTPMNPQNKCNIW